MINDFHSNGSFNYFQMKKVKEDPVCEVNWDSVKVFDFQIII